jgi:hypothetical protein
MAGMSSSLTPQFDGAAIRETAMDISLAMKASVPTDVLIQELQGESVLLNVKSGRYFGLDEVGTRMWAALTTTPSLSAACETLLAEYDVERGRLERDLRSLVEKLVEHGLLEVGGA